MVLTTEKSQWLKSDRFYNGRILNKSLSPGFWAQTYFIVCPVQYKESSYVGTSFKE